MDMYFKLGANTHLKTILKPTVQHNGMVLEIFLIKDKITKEKVLAITYGRKLKGCNDWKGDKYIIHICWKPIIINWYILVNNKIRPGG